MGGRLPKGTDNEQVIKIFGINHALQKEKDRPFEVPERPGLTI